MPVKHRRSWPRRIVIRFPAPPKKLLRNLILLVLLVGILLFALRLTGYLRELSGAMALSDAEDLVIDTVNEAVMAMMASGEYDYNYFVSMEKDADGNELNPERRHLSHLHIDKRPLLIEDSDLVLTRDLKRQMQTQAVNEFVTGLATNGQNKVVYPNGVISP